MPVRFAGDGVTLTADAEGAWSGPAVLLLHGGGQTRLLRVAPQAQAIDVAGAGHMVAGDRNDVFSSAVADFLIKETL